MIIKERDSRQSDIDELNALLSMPLSENKRFLVERELCFIKAGDRGENDAAYFIDFHYGHSTNWAIIHDLRLEHEGRIAQIDHLLINRFLDMYVLETKNFSYGVKITESGEFLVFHNNRYYAIESPIEQNKRHLLVLEKLIKDFGIMPKRLGMTMNPALISYILVSPKSRVIRPAKSRFNSSSVIKADVLATEINRKVDNLSALSAIATASKVVSTETLVDVAGNLSAFHRPIKIDYKKKFGVEQILLKDKQSISSTDSAEEERFYCSKCKQTISQKVANFCWDNKKRFGGVSFPIRLTVVK